MIFLKMLSGLVVITQEDRIIMIITILVSDTLTPCTTDTG